jgi:hypothetical protein
MMIPKESQIAAGMRRILVFITKRVLDALFDDCLTLGSSTCEENAERLMISRRERSAARSRRNHAVDLGRSGRSSDLSLSAAPIAPKKKLRGASDGEIRAAKERVAQRFGAQEEPRSYRRYETRLGRRCRTRSYIDASRKLLANNGLEARQREGIVHRCRPRKKGVRVGWKTRIVVCEEIGQHHAKYSIARETIADFTQESHRIGDEINRVSDVNKLISHSQIHFLNLSVSHANPNFPMHLRNRSVGVDPFRIPAVVGECLHGFAKPAGNVEKALSTISGERRESPEGTRGNRAGVVAAARPGTL